MLKILALITSCQGCTHHRYGSGGGHDCDLVGEQIIDASRIASFCPLTDFPSNQIARLERTVQSLRQPDDFGLYWALMSFIVKKSGCTLSADGRYITFTRKDEEPIYLVIDSIVEIDLRQGHIVFLYEKDKYAFVTSTPPQLLKEVSLWGDESEKGWQEVRISEKG